MRHLRSAPVLLFLVLASACHDKGSGAGPAASAAASASARASAAASVPPPPPPPLHGAIDREDLNRSAVRLNLPLYWMGDKNKNSEIDPDEVASLLFYPTEGHWVAGGKFTPEFEAKLAAIRAKAPAPAKLSDDEEKRRLIVGSELDQGAATLVYNDLRAAPATDKAFVQHMLAAAKHIDDLYGTMVGAKAMASRVPADDPASQSLFRRNWGPRCRAPLTEPNPLCSAIPGAPAPLCDAYPAALQSDPKFCDALEKLPNAKTLLDHFVVVRDDAANPGKLAAVSYAEAYKEPMRAVADELRAASTALGDGNEPSLKAYLEAAAQSFTTNDWDPSDEAWSKMTAQSSKWYVRAAADEVYWDPCNHKAGFHLTFAKINADSLKWQEKLTPIESEMEKTLATLIGPPYAARKVTFHLPDFIDIVFNAGDDRNAIGATIGESLPNWGKVVAQGRGRTVAMSNLYTDPDSLAVRRKQAESLLTADAVKPYVDSAEPGLLATILHEATHNLGPAHEYAFKGKTDEQAFGGGLASMLEELKAQTGGLYFVELLRSKGLISDELARQTYADEIVWAFGHISRGMYEANGVGKPYSQLAAIQLGLLMDDGVVTFDPTATAANGRDKGVLAVDYAKFPASIDKMMKTVGTIKATTDKEGALALVKKYVDGTVVPQKVITDRELRFPKASFVYAIDM